MTFDDWVKTHPVQYLSLNNVKAAWEFQAEQIKQLTAERDLLRAALEEIQQLTDPFSIEMAIKEALKGAGNDL